MVHPSKRIRGVSSDRLAGKRIVLGVCGSIGAVKTVELARELIRHGADVVPVMTAAARGIVHPDALTFATGHEPLLSLSGHVEHVAEFGAQGDADLLLVAPATANTIAKMALGIDDTALTTFATVALGAGRPVLVAPAMHAPMEENPPTQAHLASLKSRGVGFVRPLYEEGKAKLAPVDAIVAEVMRALGPQTLSGQRVLVVTGASSEPMDPVRVVTNRSSGRMGNALAWEAHRLGADVTVVTSPNPHAWPPGVSAHHYDTLTVLLETIDTHLVELDPDWVLVPAALSDFAPEAAAAKLSSDQEAIDVTFTRLPKAMAKIRDLLPEARLVSWKLQDTLDEAVDAARDRLERDRADAVVANGRDAMGAEKTVATLVTRDGSESLEGTKADVARQLFAALLQRFPSEAAR